MSAVLPGPADRPVERVLERLQGVRRTATGWLGRCPVPGHGKGKGDVNPSLSITEAPDGRVLLRCHAGCPTDAVVKALGIEWTDLFSRQEPEPQGHSSNGKARGGLTVRALAEAKRLPLWLLEKYCEDLPGGVRFIYRGEDGRPLPVTRIRLALEGPSRFRWGAGDRPLPFGLDRLAKARKRGWLILVEGETDCLTAWTHGLSALGLPGANTTVCLEAEHLRGITRLWVVKEPDEGGRAFVLGIARRLKELGWTGEARVLDLAPHKDVSDLHLAVGSAREAFLKTLADAVHRSRLLDEVAAELERATKSAGESAEAAGRGGRRPGASALLVELAAEEDVELFHDPSGEAWATIRCGDHFETYPLRSRGFRTWLASRFYRREGRPPGSQALQDALDVLEARARFDGPCHEVHVRVAEHDGRVYLDLADPSWRVVEIGPDSWRIVTNSPVRFWRPRGLLPLPEPVRGGSLEELRPFVNGDKTAFTLVTAWLVGALRPRGPYPVLELTGEQGSGKSTLARMLRALLDPHEVALRRLPRDERDLFIAASNSWVVALDNLSGVPWWLSDALCVLATGGGFAARTLYTDRDETLLDAQRPIILTGITELAAQPDLQDRTIRVELRRLDEGTTLDEATLWARFEEASPRILGALLDAVSAALRCWRQVRLERVPRMADFSRWVAAAELGGVLPWKPNTFLRTYLDQREAAAATVLEEPVAVVLLKLLESGPWSGTATELLAELDALADERAARSKSWPQTPKALADRLRRLAPELRRAAGVEVTFGRTGKNRTRLIVLERRCNSPSAPSALSAGGENAETKRPSGSAPADDGRTISGMADDPSSAGSSARPEPETLVAQGVWDLADDADEADDPLRRCSRLSHTPDWSPFEEAAATGERDSYDPFEPEEANVEWEWSA